MQYLSSAFNDQIILSKLKGNACVPGDEPINVYECHLLIFLLFLMEGGSYSHDVFAPIGNTCERESCITKEGYLTNERGWQMCDLILASFPKELPEFRVLLLELGPNQCCRFVDLFFTLMFVLQLYYHLDPNTYVSLNFV